MFYEHIFLFQITCQKLALNHLSEAVFSPYSDISCKKKHSFFKSSFVISFPNKYHMFDIRISVTRAWIFVTDPHISLSPIDFHFCRTTRMNETRTIAFSLLSFSRLLTGSDYASPSGIYYKRHKYLLAFAFNIRYDTHNRNVSFFFYSLLDSRK